MFCNMTEIIVSLTGCWLKSLKFLMRSCIYHWTFAFMIRIDVFVGEPFPCQSVCLSPCQLVFLGQFSIFFRMVPSTAFFAGYLDCHRDKKQRYQLRELWNLKSGTDSKSYTIGPQGKQIIEHIFQEVMADERGTVLCYFREAIESMLTF